MRWRSTRSLPAPELAAALTRSPPPGDRVGRRNENVPMSFEETIHETAASSPYRRKKQCPAGSGLAALLRISLLAAMAACGGESTQPTPTAWPTLTSPPPASVLSGDASGITGPVRLVSHAEPSLKDLELSSKTMFVSVGAKITWSNDDDVAHTLTSNDGWFDAEVAPGSSYTWEPNQAGVFRDYCRIHGNVQGTIVVAEGGASAPVYYGGKPIPKYFGDNCGGCHGANREGGTGPALIPGCLTSDDEFYHDVILNGRPGTVMAGWSLLGLSHEEAWGLVGYLRTEPEAEAVKWEQDDIAGYLVVMQDEASLPDEPTHSGDIADLLLVMEREDRKIAVIDGDTSDPLSHIPASYRAHGYAFNPVQERWAYNLGRDGWVFKIDLYTLSAVRKVRVGHDSRGLAVSDDGKYLLAGNYIPTSAVMLDAETLEPLKVFTTEGVNPDGEFVSSRVAITSDVAPDLVGPYFLIELKEAGQVWRINYSDPEFPVGTVHDVGRILHDGFLRADNRRFYLASQTDNWMAVIDVKDMEVVDRIATGDVPHPGSGAVWEAEGKMYGATVHAGEGTTTIWDLETNEIVGRVETAGLGLFISSHEHSPYVWADALFGTPSNVITVFEKSPSFNKVADIAEGVMTLHPEFNADGSLVYVSDWKGRCGSMTPKPWNGYQ